MRRLVMMLDRVGDAFARPVPVHPVALGRILLGATLAFQYAVLLPDAEVMFGPDGLLRYTMHPTGEVPFHHARYALILWAALLGSVGLCLGLLTRLSAVVLLLAHMQLIADGTWWSWGWSRTAPVFVIYLALANAGARVSLDARIRRWRRPEQPPVETLSGWAVRLMMLHVCCIYLAAAWHRIDDNAWMRGEMVYEALTVSLFTRFPDLDFLRIKTLLWVACWYTLVVELAAPLLLAWRRTRTVFALLLLSVHVGLELGASVGMWQFMMCSALMLFLPDRWCRRALLAPTGEPPGAPCQPLGVTSAGVSTMSSP